MISAPRINYNAVLFGLRAAVMPLKGVMPLENILHDTEYKHFTLKLEGYCSYLAYQWVDSNTIDIYRTFVPEAMRGQGIAEQLVQEALKWAKAEHLKVVPSCSYVATYMKRKGLISE